MHLFLITLSGLAEIFLKVAVNTIALTLSLKTLRDSKT
jgi:hypothetical protein